jgi:hypothetical protein
MTHLPELTTTPTRHPHCCASLSLTLLSHLDAILPAPPRLTLSIGSGSGLLEALLLHHHPTRAGIIPISLFGIEVSSSDNAAAVNRFLPEQNATEVPGTWAVSNHVMDATALLFVYPRQTALVKGYLEKATGAEVVVWIGPVADKEEFVGVLEGWGTTDDGGGDGGLSEGEAMAVYRRAV